MLAAMAKTLEWTHAGPAREAAKEVPPVSVGNYGYALVFDEQRKCLVYVRMGEYGGGLEQWTFDGKQWAQVKMKTNARADNECHAYWDTTRKAVLLWSTGYDSTLKRHVPEGVAVDASGARAVETKGEPPLIEPKSKETFYLSSNIGCTLTFDPLRGVAVCFTRHGIWELDAKGAWSKKDDGGGLIPAEWHNDAGGVWDPVGQRCFFWLQKRGDGYGLAFFAWDGTKLSAISHDGLEDVRTGLADTCTMFTAHPTHGVVAWIGAGHGMYALGQGAWKKLPDTKFPPPIMTGRFATGRPHIAYDAKRDLFVIGPGYFKDDDATRESQRVFWVLEGGTWERQGSVARPSPLAALRSRRHAMVGSTWCACEGLRAMAWTDGGWRELVDEKTADKVAEKHESIAALASTPKGLVAVSARGGVLVLDGKKWQRLSSRSPAFKERTDFVLVHDASHDRLVAWGGEIKNRKANDTLFFDGKKWTPAKATSPMPKDYKKSRDAEFVDFTATSDTALGHVVRFGYAEIAVLDGEVWKPFAPRAYKALVGPRTMNHLPAHDPKTGETLLVDFDAGRVVRFDLAECVEVARFEYPANLVLDAKREHRSVGHLFASDVIFDPHTRTLQSQQADNRWGRWSLDLSGAFDAAKKLGARKPFGPSKGKKVSATIHLYRATKGELAHWSGPEDKAAAKLREGWVKATALPTAVLERIGTRRSSELHVGKKISKLTKHTISRVGGLPSGVPADKWPKRGGKPMGFLFQLLTGDVLAKHAAIAVFCATDGTATEDEIGGANVVMMLSAADLKRTPPKTAPKGVLVLPVREILVKPALVEIDESAVEALAERDPEMGAAFDRYQAKQKVQESSLGSKLGGAAWLLQGGELPSNARFIAQLDVDDLDVDPWEDAGLMGCIYVFTGPEEKKAAAFWQYT
jgi:hypothetical protein